MNKVLYVIVDYSGNDIPDHYMASFDKYKLLNAYEDYIIEILKEEGQSFEDWFDTGATYSYNNCTTEQYYEVIETHLEDFDLKIEKYKMI